MKKTLFSLVTMMVLGIGVMNGQNVQEPKDCPEGTDCPKEMPMHHGKEMDKKHHRPHIEPVKSTPKCKCQTCVELRKREEIQSQIDSLRKEKENIQHQIDSLRGDNPHKDFKPMHKDMQHKDHKDHKDKKDKK